MEVQQGNKEPSVETRRNRISKLWQPQIRKLGLGLPAGWDHCSGAFRIAKALYLQPGLDMDPNENGWNVMPWWDLFSTDHTDQAVP